MEALSFEAHLSCDPGLSLVDRKAILELARIGYKRLVAAIRDRRLPSVVLRRRAS